MTIGVALEEDEAFGKVQGALQSGKAVARDMTLLGRELVRSP